MMTDYVPALVAILGGLGFAGLFVLLAVTLGPKRTNPAREGRRVQPESGGRARCGALLGVDVMEQL